MAVRVRQLRPTNKATVYGHFISLAQSIDVIHVIASHTYANCIWAQMNANQNGSRGMGAIRRRTIAKGQSHYDQTSATIKDSSVWMLPYPDEISAMCS